MRSNPSAQNEQLLQPSAQSGANMKCCTTSWLRPANRSLNVCLPLGPSDTYTLSTLPRGGPRRSSLSRSRALVYSFSWLRCALRASIHCSRETILCGCGCMTGSSLIVSGDIFFKLVEHADPPALVAVACGLIEELLMVKRQQRTIAVRLQRNRHQRFAFRRRMPRPAEHQPLVRHHLAIDAAGFVILVVGREDDAEAPADPRVDVRLHRANLGVRGPEPTRYFLRVRPRGVDFLRRGIETAFDGEARPGDETGVAGSA